LSRLEDLAAAVDKEHIHSKLEYLDRSTRPAKRIVRRLTTKFFRREAAIVPFWNTVSLKARTEKAVRMRPYALSLWAPDVKRIWPSSAKPAPKRRAPAELLAARKPAGKGTPSRKRRQRQFAEAIVGRCYPNGVPDKVTTREVELRILKEWPAECAKHSVEPKTLLAPKWHAVDRLLGRRR
jgi:hypothetical protein